MASQQWTEDVEPGDATLTRHADGTVTVQHADPVIALDPELLDYLAQQPVQPAHVGVGDDGTLVLDTAGEYRYQRVGERWIDGRTMMIYRRVQR